MKYRAYRVLRGGSYYDDSGFLRASYRLGYEPEGRGRISGFRIAVRRGP